MPSSRSQWTILWAWPSACGQSGSIDVARELVALDGRHDHRDLQEAVVARGDVANPTHRDHSTGRGYDPEMALFPGLALVFLLVVVVVGTIASVRRAKGLWHSVRSFERVIGRAMDDTQRRADAMNARLAAAGETSARLDAAVARLRTSRARAAVLASAMGEVRTTIRRALAVFPT